MGNVVPSCTSPGYSREANLSSSRRKSIFRDGLYDDSDDNEDSSAAHCKDNRGGGGIDASLSSSAALALAIRYQTRTEQDVFSKSAISALDSGISSSSSSSTPQLLLDPTQVMSALLEQAEELLRQETKHQNLLDDLENLLREDDDDDDDDSASTSTGSSSTSSSRSSSTPPRSASNLDNVLQEDDDDDDDSRGDIFSNLSDNDLDSRIDGGRSLATHTTHTVFTTGTAATQPAKNVARKHPRRNTKAGIPPTAAARGHDDSNVTKLVRYPPASSTTKLLPDVSSFAATQMLQSQIQTALSVHARKALSKPYLRSAEQFQETLRNGEGGHSDKEERSSHRFGPSAPPPCHVPCGAMGNWNWLRSFGAKDPRDAEVAASSPNGNSSSNNNERVLRYMRALYLHIPSRSAAYMRRNPRLKRLLPENPVSLAHADPSRTGSASSLWESLQNDRDVRKRMAENKGGSADGVLAALSSSSGSAVPAMQLLTMSTSHSTGNDSGGDRHRIESYRDDEVVDEVEFGTNPDGIVSVPVRMWITNQVFLDLAVTGSLGWVRNPPSREVSRTSAASSEPYLALINRRSSIPLVVCTPGTGTCVRGRSGCVTVLVQATKRRYSDQRPTTTTRKLQRLGPHCSPPSEDGTGDTTSYDLPLYSWAKVVIEGSYPHRVTYSVYMSIGFEGGGDGDDYYYTTSTSSTDRYELVPQYVAVHDSFRSPEVVVTARSTSTKSSGFRPDFVGCAVISLCHRNGTGVGSSSSHDLGDVDDVDDVDDPARGEIGGGGGGGGGVVTRVAVSATGTTDPALLLCLGAVVDEYMERSLQIQSRGLAEAVYKRSHRAL